jgi:hypothetical protein
MWLSDRVLGMYQTLVLILSTEASKQTKAQGDLEVLHNMHKALHVITTTTKWGTAKVCPG